MTPKGAKSWLYRYRAPGGRIRELGLGSLEEVGLAEPRRRVVELRAELAAGRDPLDAREPARVEPPPVPTFTELAERVIEEKVPG